MSLPPDDRKIDLSNIPRGAIGIKGVPVSRNARLPSIRTPRDLTLAAQKRTFLPNIPVRREKRAPDLGKDNANASLDVNQRKDIKFSPKIPDRGRGRGRGRGQIIQTEGSVFGEGIAASATKGRQKESASQRSSFSSGRASVVKREKMEVSMSDINRDMDNLMRDDFIDDGDDDKLDAKPITFPLQKDEKVKKTNIKSESRDTKESFNNQDFAKEMGFDVKKIAKFIKKEKGDEDHGNLTPMTGAGLPNSQISELLTSHNPQMLLLRFPECISSPLSDYQSKGQTNIDTVPPSDQKTSENLSSLPEGHIGKLQVLKSGRTRLVIGSLHLNLDSFTSLKSRHEVASIHADSDSGDIILLGSVNEKLSFFPDVHNLLS